MVKLFNILTSWKAISIYAVLSLAVFILNSPFCQIRLEHFLADITQQAIIEQINPIRTEQGYLGLKANAKLTQAAQMKAEDMIKNGYFSHVDPNGEEPWSWFEKVDYDYAAAGENLAVNYFDANILIKAWLNSPAHAKNILNGYFTDVGIGMANGDIPGKGGSTVVVMFLGREITPAIRVAASQAVVVNSVPAEDIKNIAPEKPVVKKTVSDIALEDQNKIQQTNINNIQKIEKDYTKYSKLKISLANTFTYDARLILTAFFMFLFIWAFVTISIHKERFYPIKALRPFIFVFFILILWLPELIY